MKNTDEQREFISLKNYLYALQQRNLVYNHDFRYFSNRNINGNVTDYGIPDGWQYQDPGQNGTIGFDNTTMQCVIKKSGGNELMEFKQALHEFPRWEQALRGKTVSAQIIMSAGKSGDVTVSLSDGINTSSVTRSGNQSMTFDIQLQTDPAATGLILSLTTTVPYMTLNIDYATANLGHIPLRNLPCMVQGIIGERKQYIATETPPAEELSLCNGLKELDGNYTRLRSVIGDKFGINSTNGNPYLINMGGYFSRAWDNGSGIDPDAGDRTKTGQGNRSGDHVSSSEKDIFLKHDHGLNFSLDKQILTGDKGATTVINTTTTSKTNPQSEGKETRPINIAELYTIKWA